MYLALVTALISGFSNFINKFAVTAISPPLFFTAVKNTGVGLLIISSLLLTKKWKLIKFLNHYQLSMLIALSLLGGSLPFYLYFTGLSQVPASTAVLLRSALVPFVILLAIPFLKEKLSPLRGLAFLLIFLSNFSLGGFSGFEYSSGEFLIILSSVFWAVETILAKKILSEVDPDILTAFRMGLGSILLLSASIIYHPSSIVQISHLSSSQFLWLTLTMSTLFFYVSFWYRALKKASAITVTVILSSASLVTNLLSAIFITHKLSSDLFFQISFLVSGISVILFTSSRFSVLLWSRIRGFFAPAK
jgi:drug/metabolite transporter (DMT)-like permease